MLDSYGGRKGVRYMTNGLKVYYLPITPMVDENALPTTFAWFPLFREILIREEVTIVHGHQATSSMMHEATERPLNSVSAPTLRSQQDRSPSTSA